MKVLFSADDIAARTNAMAKDIARDLPADFIMAPVLTGAIIFAADLLRAITRVGHDPLVCLLYTSPSPRD